MDYAEQLKDHRQKVDALAPHLASIRRSFVDHAAGHLKKLIDGSAKSEVERKTEITLKLSDSALARMKKRVQKLANSAPALAAEHLDTDDIWRLPADALPHEIASARLSTHDLSRRLEEALRLVVGQLGPILADCGYVSISPQSDRHKVDVWCEYDSSGNHYKTGGRPRYPYALELSPQLKQDMVEYTTCASEIATTRHEMAKLQAEWDSQKAKTRWDSL